MPRKLKTYQTSMGFYELAIAAPSMKAALEAWGAESNLFHQGMARQVEDPDIVKATMSKPGIVLKRAVGSTGKFTEDAALPTDLADGDGRRPQSRKRAAPKSKPPKQGPRSARKAAVAYEKQQAKRERQRLKEEAAQERRAQAVAHAKGAIEDAEQDHGRRMRDIENERHRLEKRAQIELTRWEALKEKLEAALRRARR